MFINTQKQIKLLHISHCFLLTSSIFLFQCLYFWTFTTKTATEHNSKFPTTVQKTSLHMKVYPYYIPLFSSRFTSLRFIQFTCKTTSRLRHNWSPWWQQSDRIQWEKKLHLLQKPIVTEQFLNCGIWDNCDFFPSKAIWSSVLYKTSYMRCTTVNF